MANRDLRAIQRRVVSALTTPSVSFHEGNVDRVSRDDQTARVRMAGSPSALVMPIAGRDLTDHLAAAVQRGTTPTVTIRDGVIVGLVAAVATADRRSAPSYAPRPTAPRIAPPVWRDPAVVGGVKQLTGFWEGVAVAHLAEYRLQARSTTGSIHDHRVPASDHQGTIIVPPGEYQVHVQAVLSTGETGEWSTPHTAIATADRTPPDPVRFDFRPGATHSASWEASSLPDPSLTIRWTNPDLIPSDFAGYTVEVQDFQGSVRRIVEIAGIQSTFTYAIEDNQSDGPAAAAAVTIIIRTRDHDGNRSSPAAISARYPPLPAPLWSRMNWRDEADPAVDLTLRWHSQPVLPALVNYQLTILNLDGSPRRIVDLAAGSPQYTYRLDQNASDSEAADQQPVAHLRLVVAAQDAFGRRTESERVTVLYPSPPSPPTGVRTSWSPETPAPGPDLDIVVTWDHVAARDSWRGIEYEWWSADQTELLHAGLLTGNPSQIIYRYDTHVTVGLRSEVFLRIRRRDVFLGGTSAWVGIVNRYPTPPDPPSQLISTWDNAQTATPDLEVTWTPPVMRRAWMGYEVEWRSSQAVIRRRVGLPGQPVRATYTLAENLQDSPESPDHARYPESTVMVAIRSIDVFSQTSPTAGRSAWVTRICVAPIAAAPRTPPAIETIFKQMTASVPVTEPLPAFLRSTQMLFDGAPFLSAPNSDAILAPDLLIPIPAPDRRTTVFAPAAQTYRVQYRWQDVFNRVSPYSPAAEIMVAALDLGFHDLATMQQLRMFSTLRPASDPGIEALVNGRMDTDAIPIAAGESFTIEFPLARNITGLTLAAATAVTPAWWIEFEQTDGTLTALVANSASDHTVVGTPGNILLRRVAETVPGAHAAFYVAEPLQAIGTSYARTWRFGDIHIAPETRLVRNITTRRLIVHFAQATTLSEIRVETYEAAQLFMGRRLSLTEGLIVESAPGVGTTSSGFVMSTSAISGYFGSQETGRIDNQGTLWWTRGGFGGTAANPAVQLESTGLVVARGGAIRSGATDWLSGNGVWLQTTGATPPNGVPAHTSIFRVGATANGILTSGVSWDGSTLAVKGQVTIQPGSSAINGAALTGGGPTAGLNLTAEYLGYYTGTTWPVYIRNNGTFRFGSASEYIQYDGSAFSVVGNGGGITNINGGAIQTGTITAAALAANSITASKIAIGTWSDNLILNPSGEAGTEGWTIVEGSGTLGISTTYRTEGRASIQCTTSTSSAVGARKIPVTPGATYTVRVKVMGTGGAGQFALRLQEANADVVGDWITATARTSVSDVISGVPIPATWTLFEYVYTVPPGVLWASFAVRTTATTATPLSIYLDEVDVRRQLRGVHLQDGTITAQKLVLGSPSNLLNNFSQTNRLTGWIGWETAGTLVMDRTKQGVPVRTLRLTTSGDAIVHSDLIEVDPNSSYEFTLSVYSDHPDATGTRFVGLLPYDENKQAIAITPFHAINRTWEADQLNPYWWYGSVYGGEWRDLAMYLLRQSATEPEIPQGKNVLWHYRMLPNTRYIRLRFLNFYNAGVTVRNDFYNPSLRQIAHAQIHGNLIVSDTIRASSLSAVSANTGSLNVSGDLFVGAAGRVLAGGGNLILSAAGMTINRADDYFLYRWYDTAARLVSEDRITHEVDGGGSPVGIGHYIQVVHAGVYGQARYRVLARDQYTNAPHIVGDQGLLQVGTTDSRLVCGSSLVTLNGTGATLQGAKVTVDAINGTGIITGMSAISVGPFRHANGSPSISRPCLELNAASNAGWSWWGYHPYGQSIGLLFHAYPTSQANLLRSPGICVWGTDTGTFNPNAAMMEVDANAQTWGFFWSRKRTGTGYRGESVTWYREIGITPGAVYFDTTVYKPGGGTFADSSDRRVKENIRPYEHGIEFIKRLPHPDRFDFNGLGGTTAGRSAVGFIAQELQGVAPEWVGTHADHRLIDGSPVLTSDLSQLPLAELVALKELIARVETLEAEITRLRAG